MDYPDSKLLTLLNQRYGFQFERHRKGFYRFQWRLKGKIVMVMPFEVPFMGAERARVAAMLGLSADELAVAEANPTTYSVSCLLFVLIVTQLRRSLSAAPAFRASLGKDAAWVLDEIETSIGDCSLLAGTLESCKAIARDVALSTVGNRLLGICGM